MARIICLANSYRKTNGRCVAGLDTSTGDWVRPVLGKDAAGEDLPIPALLTRVGGRELRALDIVSIPLTGGYREDRFQRENRLLGKGAWTLEGRAKPSEVMKIVEEPGLVFFNRGKAVKATVLAAMAPAAWQSLLLIRRTARFFTEQCEGRDGELETKKRASFQDGLGNTLSIAVTDPFICDRLNREPEFQGEYLLTVSLATPYPEAGELEEQWCHKIVAAAIGWE